MDPAAVAAYYRAKGYVVRDGARVPAPNGAEHRVPLLAEGPLGSLAVFFGGEGGIAGPEMGGARRVARDIGATPVLAAPTFTAQDRQAAARLGVVLLDDAALAGDGTPTAPSLALGADTGRAWPGLAPLPARQAKPSEPEPHPWPASGRVGGRDGPATRAVDVDEILAGPAGAPAAGPAAPEAVAPGSSPAAGPAAAAPGSAAEDAAGLWKRPRAQGSPAKARPRAPGSQRFGWLGPDVATQLDQQSASRSQGGAALAVEYDDVVPARRGRAEGGEGAAAAAPGAPDEHMDDGLPLDAPLAEREHQARRDRLLRRVFWVLFLVAVAWLLVALLPPLLRP